MKITRDTPDILIVEERPWVLGLGLISFILVFVAAGGLATASGEPFGLLFGAVGGGMGLLAFYIFVRRVQVVFHRPGNWVEIRRRSMRRQTTVRHDLSEIGRAVIEESGGSNKTTYRITLIIPDGPSQGRHPLTLHYSNVGDQHGIAERINAWLARTTS